MESTNKNLEKYSRNGESTSQHDIESLQSNEEITLVLKKCQRKLNPPRTIILEVRRSKSRNDFFIRNFHGLHNSIPKLIRTVDEKYIQRCLESIHNRVLRAATWKFSSRVDNDDNLGIEYPLVGKTDEVIASTPIDWIIGTLSGSQTMINILKSPLLEQFGSLDECTDSVREPNNVSYLRKELKVQDRKYLSDHSSSYSANGVFFQGLLQSKWENGVPNHVFTVVDKNEIYVAKLSKIESLDEKQGLDYVYTFRRSSNGKDECETTANMFVSTSIKFSSDNSEIRETRFILSVSNNRSDNDCFDLAPNLELAAIIVKEVFGRRNEARLGGWGLKFLKRPSLDTSISSESCRDNVECSTSVDVIIPAGFHGGPRTRVGGPLGLTERWVSGGGCDCGGWDIGCPVTILKPGSSGTDDYSFRDDNYGECKSVDLFIQGSKQNAPIMKLVNFDECSYYIHFQSTLSSLQSLAVAAAIIHSRSPFLRSKVRMS